MISDVEVLVQTGQSVVRNLVDHKVLSGTQPMVIVEATNVDFPDFPPQLVEDLCLSIPYDLGAAESQTIEVTVRNLDGESTGRFTIVQGSADDDRLCDTMGQPPEADAGGPYTAEVPAGAAEAPIQLDGSASRDDNDVPLASWSWEIRDDSQALVTTANGERPQIMLPEGSYIAVLTVTDRDGELLGPSNEPVDVSKTGTATTTITVGEPTTPPNEVPVSNAGPDQTLTDEDGDGFEPVQLDGSQSTDDVGIVSYSWSEDGEQIATGAQPAPLSLPVGTHTIVLRVTDEGGLFDDDTVVISIGEAPSGRRLTSLSGLAPHERSLATAIDSLCPRLAERALDSTISRPPEEQELLAACSGLKSSETTEAQALAGLKAMAGEEIVTEQTNALDYSTVQLSNIGARIVALRRGTGGGVSIAGLNVNHDGRTVPLSQLGAFVNQLLNGGAASGDEDDEGGLLSSRLGVFVNGNIRTGDKDETANEAGFDFDSWGITAGVDYRFTDNLVLGLSLGYNESETKFAGDGGGMDGDGTSTSIYGTYFSDNLYFDFIGSTGSVDFDSTRRIVYTDIAGAHDLTALGRTDGDLTTFGMSFGYDFHSGGWTFGPTLSVNKIEVEVDPFAETGAGGLNLAFGEQNAESQTLQGGFRFSYALSRSWGVLSPHARLTFVKEMENDSEAVIVNFVSDPFVNDPNQPSPGIAIITDDPDEEYIRWGGGLSAVFANGISAFVDYETYAGFRNISSHELSFGVRFERSFR